MPCTLQAVAAADHSTHQLEMQVVRFQNVAADQTIESLTMAAKLTLQPTVPCPEVPTSLFVRHVDAATNKFTFCYDAVGFFLFFVLKPALFTSTTWRTAWRC
jgi:hypothetical protein